MSTDEADSARAAADAAKTANRLQSHFWVTASAVGTNAFLIAGTFHETAKWTVAIVSFVLSFLAYFVVVEIAGSDIESDPVHSLQDRHHRRKLLETKENWRLLGGRSLYVLCEFKGAFYYCALIWVSWLGVLARITELWRDAT